MIRLLLFFLTALAFGYLALFVSDGKTLGLISVPLPIAVGLSTLVGALSVGFHAYIDGIVKDLPSRSGNEERIDQAVSSLGALRREIISNAVLILALLVVYWLALGIRASIADGYEASLRVEVDWVLASIQFACVCMMIYAAAVQFQGFHTATRLRDVLAKNR